MTSSVSGNEKGLVEGLVGCIRRNTCVPVPRVTSLDELNSQLKTKCDKYVQHHIRGKETDVHTMLIADKAALYDLPDHRFDPAKRTFSRVDRFSTIRFDTNNYSVPTIYCGKEMTIKALPEQVQIFSEGAIVAEHQRCFTHQQSIYKLEHYLPILERKGRAIFYANPVKDNVPAYFLDWLRRQELTPKQLTELLWRCQNEGCEAVMLGNAAPQSQPDPIIEDTILVQAVDLHLYDNLLCAKVGVTA